MKSKAALIIPVTWVSYVATAWSGKIDLCPPRRRAQPSEKVFPSGWWCHGGTMVGPNQQQMGRHHQHLSLLLVLGWMRKTPWGRELPPANKGNGLHEGWWVGLVEKFNFNYTTRLWWSLMGNLILKLVCFPQLFDLSTPLDVIWHI